MRKVAIVGGGSSGLLCAIVCAKASWHVDIYEQNNKCGKKILVSGNGRCNITNKNLSKHDYFSQNPDFVEHALKQFGFNEFKKFCTELGLLFDEKEDGRCYPLSNEAKSVVATLTSHAKTLGVHIHLEQKINSLDPLFEKYDAVVVATGSEAASHLGGNADGMNFASSYGHNIIPTYPSLVQLHLDSHLHAKMAGAKVDGEVTLLINHKPTTTIAGDILFTNYGVSGFAILDISQEASVALQEFSHVGVSLNLLPRFNAQKLAQHFSSLATNIPKAEVLTALSALIPLKMAQGILTHLEFPHAKMLETFNTKEFKKLANTVLNWRFEVSETHGFRHAEVSGGGVDTTEVNPKSMESLKKENLYFCGEVLDVVGKRGGYNFAFAWASGYVAAQSITKN